MTPSHAAAPLKNGLMITWNKECFRSSATGLALDIEVHYVWPDYGKSTLGKFRRYVVSFLQTVRIIRWEKPEVVVVHNLPVFLLIAASSARIFNRHQIVLDFHSGALTHPVWSKFKWVYARVVKNAPFILAHNRFDGKKITGFGGTPVYMICLPRDMPDYPSLPAPQVPKILVVCSFAPDEPVELFWEAAKSLPDVEFAITGNYKKRRIEPENVPANVTLLGFVDRDQYFTEMSEATAVVTLSDRPNIMQMAIHEAVSLGVPVITNHSATTEPVLEEGGVFCELTVPSLTSAVQNAVTNAPVLREAARSLKARRVAEVQEELNQTSNRLSSLFKPV